MKFEWISDWDIIWSDDFVDKWNGWMQTSENAHVFFHPSLLKAWVDTYTPIRDIRPMFCIATQGDTTIFLPLVLWKKNWKNAFENTIVPAGYSDYDYQNPIAVSKNISQFNWTNYWTELYEEINIHWKGKFDLFEVDGLKKSLNTNEQNWIVSDECPFIDLKAYDTYTDFLGAFKTKERSNVKRQIRRLEEQGTFIFETLGSDRKSEILDILPTVLYEHTLRWPKAYKAPNYHYNLIVNALENDLLYFSQITINGEAISWNISFIYKNTCYFYMSIYTEKYSKFSPGKLNMFLSIGDAISKNYETFDLMRGSEEYKSKLPIDNDLVFQLVEENSSVISSLKRTLLKFKRYIL